MTGHRSSQLLTPALMLLAALIAFLGVTIPADWRTMTSNPGGLIFWLTLGAVHVAPFLIAAALARPAPPRRRAVIVAVLACLAELSLLVWVHSQLDEDAQAGLLYIFMTPPATWAIAAMAISTIGRPKAGPRQARPRFRVRSERRRA